MLDLIQTKKAIECAFESDIPLLLWGNPGVGKSSIVEQVSIDCDVELRDVRLSQIESVDLRGLPSINGDSTVWHIPSFMPTDPDSEGILFLDEINKADPSTQAAAYQLVLDRKLGDYVLPPGWRILSAANPGPDRITEALANRFAHAYVEANIRNWSVWAKSEGLSSDVIGFLNSRPELLAQMPTKQDEHAFPSPRTWEYAARIYDDHGASTGIWEELAKGCVGEGSIIELITYINLLSKLPNIDELAANPHTYDFSDSPSKQAAMAMLVVDGLTTRNADPLMQYINKIPKDFQVLVITLINETRNQLMGIKPITDWCLANPNIL